MSNPFGHLDADEFDVAARQAGFDRRGKRNWVKRTSDFVQLINLQKSQWSSENYLNFALWAVAFGEPPKLDESKFHFRTRAEDLGAHDVDGFFAAAERLSTIKALRNAEESGQIAGLMAKELRDV